MFEDLKRNSWKGRPDSVLGGLVHRPFMPNKELPLEGSSALAIPPQQRPCRTKRPAEAEERVPETLAYLAVLDPNRTLSNRPASAAH